MKQVIQNMKSGKLTVVNLPAPALKSGGILVKNHYSLISAGTERSTVDLAKMNMIQKARSRPEDIRKVIGEIKQNGFLATYRKVMSRLDAGKPMGYSSSGIVIAVDSNSSGFKVGDRVSCAGGGYANHADIVFVPKHLAVKVPLEVGLDEAAYTTLGAIAMQGVRQAQPALGENVVVIGLGLVGLLAVQILKASGCRVFGIDVNADNVALAKKIGADEACTRNADAERLVNSFSEGNGADAVIIAAATRSSDPLALAGAIARDRSRIVMIGATGMNMPRGSYYSKELEFKLSRSYGPGRYDPVYEEGGVDYPIGYVRWTENRNMKEFVNLLRAKKLDVKMLTTHRFPIDRASDAYRIISGETEESYIGILLEYQKETYEAKHALVEVNIEKLSGSFKKHPLTIGFVGAGNFAQTNLLPTLKSTPNVVLDKVCTASGISANTAVQQFGFGSVAANADEIFSDERIGTVFIATRHDLHASLAAKGLRSGKNVFVEKPLALTEEELISIGQLFRGMDEKERPVLMVGFNRRFAPLTKAINVFFEDVAEPLVINYRINAGYIPLTHWTQNPTEGGGRIIGEVCHFIDLIQSITKSKVERVFAESVSSDNARMVSNDNVNISLRMKDGSLGVVTYVANGDSALPKERIEITGGMRAAVIDNFQRAFLYKNGKEKRIGTGKIDKGITGEVESFIVSVSTDRHELITFDELVNTTLATFRVMSSLSIGEPVNL